MKYSEKLEQRYEEEIRSWDWIKIVAEAKTNCFVEDDCIMASTFIGTVFAIMPSGKYYMPWTSNQTKKDIVRDSIFQEVLNRVAEEHGAYVTCGEGDPCDLFVQFSVEPEEVLSYITSDEVERAKELIASGRLV